MEIDERVLAARFEKLLAHLDERRRLVLGAEARWLGHGGSSWSRRRRGGAQDGAGGAAELEADRSRWPGRRAERGGGASG